MEQTNNAQFSKSLSASSRYFWDTVKIFLHRGNIEKQAMRNSPFTELAPQHGLI